MSPRTLGEAGAMALYVTKAGTKAVSVLIVVEEPVPPKTLNEAGT